MSGPWPSDRLSTGRASKAPAGQRMATDWTSGLLVVLFTAIVIGGVLAALWPFAATALDSIQQLTDTLEQATRNQLCQA